MELFLNNVGIIKESEVLLDGLTVITGKNSSGKTTVGKVMYSLLSAGSDLEEAFEESRRTYLNSQLNKVEKTLRVRRSRHMHFRNRDKYLNHLDEIMTILALHDYRKFDADTMTAFMVAVKDAITDLNPDSYKEYILDTRDKYSAVDDNFINVIYENFYEWKNEALEICWTTLGLVSDKKVFYNFIKDRTSAFLIHEFNKQIKPVRYKKYASKIELQSQGKCIVSASVRAKNQVEFLEESSFVYPYNRCIFIDNPFVIDRLTSEDDYFIYRDFNVDDSKSLITSEDISERDEILKELLIGAEKKNFFDDLELQNKYKSVFKEINKIVPGEFAKTSEGYFYVDEGASLSVKNLATGSKMFFMIKKLLLNGLIDNNTMLILDEPESHLHPEWINKFAEILVLLVENIKVNVLLTTHSPNLMLALNVYARKMQLADKAHFYLAEKCDDGYFSKIRCIDESIGEGYSHLSIPLVEMNLELEELSGE